MYWTGDRVALQNLLVYFCTMTIKALYSCRGLPTPTWLNVSHNVQIPKCSVVLNLFNPVRLYNRRWCSIEVGLITQECIFFATVKRFLHIGAFQTATSVQGLIYFWKNSKWWKPIISLATSVKLFSLLAAVRSSSIIFSHLNILHLKPWGHICVVWQDDTLTLHFVDH